MNILYIATITAEASEYKDVFLYGLWTGLGWELFGVLLWVVRRIRAGTGMMD